MLTHPDRQRFEQIRARWEAAQPGEDESADMVGRKVSQQPTSGATPSNAGSNNAMLAVTAPASNTLIHQCDAPLSPTHKPASLRRPNGSSGESPTQAAHESLIGNSESDATPRALPRSQTTSFLPRPIRTGSDASIRAVTDRTTKLPPLAVMPYPKLCAVPSKIPTPSPPLSERRISSPRQYIHQHTTSQVKQIAASQAFAAYSTGSPTKPAIRSRTTPNLVKSINSQRPASYMAQTKAGLQRVAVAPAAQKSPLQENVPTSKRISHRPSQISEKSLRPESLAVPTTIASRRSFGPGATLSQGKQPHQGTPLTAKKQLSSNLAQQTPLSTALAQPPRVASSGSIAQPRLMGPRNVPTPTPPTAETPRPPLPRSSTEKDFRRKTLGTPNGLGGVWRASRALAEANYEVRRLPRSSTFHDFGTSSNSLPPVPPIPNQYRTPSLSSLFQSSLSKSNFRIVSDAASCESIPEEPTDLLDAMPYIHIPTSFRTQADQSPCPQTSDSPTGLDALPPLRRPEGPSISTPSLAPTGSQPSLAYSQSDRPWSISDYHYDDNADLEPHLQVRDYMPPLYWAGRFQARFDQWRTEALQCELNPRRETRAEGRLIECRLNQEKLATHHIFLDLRDLCLTAQAADSLWVRAELIEFEFKYRKDNKLLNNPEYPVAPPRKHDNQETHKGAFGRAVRKLTPRKSSFVNLLKGKGWGKTDDAKAHEAPEQSVETSSGSS
ncbi:hypothetical protein EK21DRAFT_58127 [Setomelanomma holmii]|uniref:Uncharacterized protein n=1 Tax=Setomelanomma holmii TaxID=210430 RepID=A0A9P4HFR3_9PLEO|nr:hypothetical protein EK21DRAFT_58127 [Setomelanomma holmii]